MRTLLMIALAAPLASAAPVELGTVAWTTDLEDAQRVSNETGRPIFMLFQEVPGCHGCVEFGKGPLTHLLLVEAIEDSFVPVAVNNRGTTLRDKQMLARFEEPYLNYPVVRFLDERASDILERRDRVYSNGALSARMIEALETHAGGAPAYLRLFALEHSESTHATATFEMHCYWEGEAHLGAIDGVVGVTSGWAGNAEVVTVTYDAGVVSKGALEREASAHACRAVEVDDPRDAKASDQSFALRRTSYRYVPMTEAQRTKVNSALRLGEDPTPFLSPRQVALHERIDVALERDPSALDGVREMPEEEAWASFVEALDALLAG